MIVQLLSRLLQRRGRSCFFDASSLVAEDVASCEKHAGAAAVLVCVLDDSFPSKWCLKEIDQAIKNGVPIVTVFDMYYFTFKDVGKDAWWKKRIPAAVTQAVFAKGTIHFNSHPDFLEQAEQRFEERLLNLWTAQFLLPTRHLEVGINEDNEDLDSEAYLEEYFLRMVADS